MRRNTSGTGPGAGGALGMLPIAGFVGVLLDPTDYLIAPVIITFLGTVVRSVTRAMRRAIPTGGPAFILDALVMPIGHAIGDGTPDVANGMGVEAIVGAWIEAPQGAKDGLRCGG